MSDQELKPPVCGYRSCIERQSQLQAADARLIALQAENERLREVVTAVQIAAPDVRAKLHAEYQAKWEAEEADAIAATQRAEAAEAQLTSLQAALARVEQALRVDAQDLAALSDVNNVNAQAAAQFMLKQADILAALTQREKSSTP